MRFIYKLHKVYTHIGSRLQYPINMGYEIIYQRRIPSET